VVAPLERMPRPPPQVGRAAAIVPESREGYFDRRDRGSRVAIPSSVQPRRAVSSGFRNGHTPAGRVRIQNQAHRPDHIRHSGDKLRSENPLTATCHPTAVPAERSGPCRSSQLRDAYSRHGCRSGVIAVPSSITTTESGDPRIDPITAPPESGGVGIGGVNSTT